jgi:putative transposase
MRNRHSPAFKAKIVAEAFKEEKTITQIASENGIHPNQISAWKAAALRGLPSLFERESKVQADHAAHQQQLEELYAQIGRLTTQVGRLKKKSGLDPHAS